MARQRRAPAPKKKRTAAVAVPEPERLPWERRKGESGAAFHNFAVYRDLGPQRSIAKAAAANGKHIDTLKEQSVKYEWGNRALAYDDFIDARLREERETERIRIERQHLGAASAILGTVLRRVNGAPAAEGPNGETIPAIARLDPNEMDAGDVFRGFETAVKVMRVSVGLPTDLIRGATAIAPHEVMRMATDIVEIASKFIPADRAQRFYSELDAYIQSGRRL